MSHELRTPLNAIAGYTELLELGIHGPLTDSQLDTLARIRHSQQHLLALITNVLNFAQIDAGRIDYEMQDLSVASALERVEELVLPQVQAKRMHFSVTLDDPALAIHADSDKLTQVLLNLLSNAVKFTDIDGMIQITGARAGDRVHILVRDTGIGIPSDRLEAIFEPFVQVDRRLDRPQDGVGLGLAISRDLARGMGGDLTVGSDVNVGSTFTLTLSAARTPTPK
jgi:signal transduction histidine kinase